MGVPGRIQLIVKGQFDGIYSPKSCISAYGYDTLASRSRMNSQSLSSKMLETILGIESRPSMYMDQPNFSALKQLLIGYFLAMEDVTGVAYNLKICEWLNKNRKHKSSLFWPEYVLILRAKGDQQKAYSLLLDTVKKFLKENQKNTFYSSGVVPTAGNPYDELKL